MRCLGVEGPACLVRGLETGQTGKEKAGDARDASAVQRLRSRRTAALLGYPVAERPSVVPCRPNSICSLPAAAAMLTPAGATHTLWPKIGRQGEVPVQRPHDTDKASLTGLRVFHTKLFCFCH